MASSTPALPMPALPWDCIVLIAVPASAGMASLATCDPINSANALTS